MIHFLLGQDTNDSDDDDRFRAELLALKHLSNLCPFYRSEI